MVKDVVLKVRLKELNDHSKRTYKFQIEGVPSRYALVVLENKGGGISLVSQFLTKGGIDDCLRTINEYNTTEKLKPLEPLD
jgi:hypothetical protein